jgi:hypothetical protein
MPCPGQASGRRGHETAKGLAVQSLPIPSLDGIGQAVDQDAVWNTATRDIPEVLVKIAPLLPQPPGTPP